MKDTKLNVIIPGELMEEMREVIPWGQRRHLIASLLRIACDAARRDGHIALGAIIDNQYTLVVRKDNIGAQD